MTKQQQIEELQTELEHRQEIENQAIDLIAKGECQQAILLLNTLDDDKLKKLEEKDTIFKSKIVKYTTYEIAEMIRKEIIKYGGKENLINELKIDSEILNDILEDCSIFSVKMYDVASTILNIPYSELTHVETIIKKLTVCIEDDCKNRKGE